MFVLVIGGGKVGYYLTKELIGSGSTPAAGDTRSEFTSIQAPAAPVAAREG